MGRPKTIQSRHINIYINISMKRNYLFAPVYKKIGWALFVPSIILIVLGLCDIEWFYTFGGSKAFCIIPYEVNQIGVCNEPSIGGYSFGIINDSWFDEITWVISMLSVVFIGFAAERDEDECLMEIRLKSLFWAVKVYAIVFIAGVLLLYGAHFLKFLSLQHFLLFILYIAKFYCELHKFRKESYEE